MTLLCVLYGPEKGDDGKHHCGCCGCAVDPNDSCGPNCWQCGFGQNPECPRCVAVGVPFHRFDGGRVKMHRLSAPIKGAGATWRAACGYSLTGERVGMATAVITTYCRHCWPDQAVT